MDAKRLLAGHLIRHSRDPEGLSKILAVFQGAVRIVKASALAAGGAARSRRGSRPDAARRGSAVGLSGVAVRDISTSSASSWGPMPQQDYDRFLPGAESVPATARLGAPISGHRVRLGNALILAKEQAHGIQLGGAPRFRPEQLAGRPSATARYRRSESQP